MSEILTRHGPARWHLSAQQGIPARGIVVLGHGACGGVESPDLLALAAELPPAGLTVVRFEQPWRVAGKKIAPAPGRLDEARLDALRSSEFTELRAGLPLVLGGRSAGARVACRTAGVLSAGGVLALSFPLHPPGRVEKTRADELTGTVVPVLVVQGERDPFGTPEEVQRAIADEGERISVRVVEQAAHDLRAGRRAVPGTEQALSQMAGEVAQILVQCCGACKGDAAPAE